MADQKNSGTKGAAASQSKTRQSQQEPNKKIEFNISPDLKDALIKSLQAVNKDISFKEEKKQGSNNITITSTKSFDKETRDNLKKKREEFRNSNKTIRKPKQIHQVSNNPEIKFSNVENFIKFQNLLVKDGIRIEKFDNKSKGKEYNLTTKQYSKTINKESYIKTIDNKFDTEKDAKNLANALNKKIGSKQFSVAKNKEGKFEISGMLVEKKDSSLRVEVEDIIAKSDKINNKVNSPNIKNSETKETFLEKAINKIFGKKNKHNNNLDSLEIDKKTRNELLKNLNNPPNSPEENHTQELETSKESAKNNLTDLSQGTKKERRANNLTNEDIDKQLKTSQELTSSIEIKTFTKTKVNQEVKDQDIENQSKEIELLLKELGIEKSPNNMEQNGSINISTKDVKGLLDKMSQSPNSLKQNGEEKIGSPNSVRNTTANNNHSKTR